MRNRCAMSNVPGPALPASARLPSSEILFTKGGRLETTATPVVAIRERNDRKVMPRKAAGFAVVFAHGRTAQAAPTRENEPRIESFVAT